MVSDNISLDNNSIGALVMNKKIKRLAWTKREYAVIKEWVGKVSVTEIAKLVNEISPVPRTLGSVQHAGNKNGFEFKVIK